MSDFQFGHHAIHTPESEARFNERRDSIVASIQPANIVEAILTEELLHASWEMERVRDNSGNTAAESQLVAAETRASRNWHRSLKQLKKLQSARAGHFAQFYQPEERRFAAQCPLADVNKIPKPLYCNTNESNESKEVN
jgi:hypothetical protein